MVSATVGVIVAIGAFVALQMWTPPAVILGLLDAAPSRKPAPERPFHTLAVKPAGAGDVIVTDADVANARGGGPSINGVPTVGLELTPAARDRLAAYAAAHAADSIVVAVDGTTIYTRPASTFAGDGARTIALPATSPLEDNSERLAARFGGALQPTPGYAKQAARLGVAIIAGLIVLFLVMLVVRR
jgi:hypothetical protein